MKNLLFALLSILFFACQSINNIGVLVPPTVDQDLNLPHQKINVAGVERLLHLRTFGNTQNPPLFVLHGSYSDSRPYKKLCEKLSEKYFVVLWDQRGCGLSERILPEEFTLETALEEINFLKEIFAKDKKISIIGHSWGGGIATLYTSRYTENIEQLVLIEPMPLISDDMNKVFDKIVEYSYFNPSWNDFARHGYSISPRKHQQIDYRALMMLKSDLTKNYHCDSNNPPNWKVHRIGGLIEWKRNQLLWSAESGFSYNFIEGLENYRNKVLVIAGECSSLGTEFQRNYTLKHFQSAAIIEIKEAGHRLIIEKEKESLEAIRSYLKEFK